MTRPLHYSSVEQEDNSMLYRPIRYAPDKQLGNIVVRTFFNPAMPDKVEYREYSWEGGPRTMLQEDTFYTGEFKFDRSKAWPDDRRWVQVGPYRLAIIYYDPMGDRYEVVRMDYPWWRFMVWKHHVGHRLTVGYHRSIFTLAIWGLADWSRVYGPPRASDIHLVKWLVRKRKELFDGTRRRRNQILGFVQRVRGRIRRP